MREYRPMREEDLDQVLAIEEQCFTQPWSRESMLRELRENSQMAHYIVACEENQVIGYGGYWQVFDEAHITNVAVAESWRRQGVAREILAAMEREYPVRGILYATLEVRVSNQAARALYVQNGFTEAGIRPRYYEKPQEDAVIMWKTIECANGRS